LQVDSIINPESLYPFVAQVSWVRAANDAWKFASVFGHQVEADGANAASQEAVNDLREVRQLVDQENVDFRPLVLKPVSLILHVAEVDFRAVPKSYFVIANDLAEAGRRPWSEQGSKAFWPLNMISDEVFANPAEKVNLKPGDFRAPGDCGDAEKVRFSRASGATEKDFRRRALEGELLARVEMDRELCSLGAHSSPVTIVVP
jgi:hypothetical protein